MTFTFSLGQVIALVGGLLAIFGGIAGTVIWLYSTFITRVEAQKLEAAVQGFILAFKEVLNEQIKTIHKRLDADRRRKPRRNPT